MSAARDKARSSSEPSVWVSHGLRRGVVAVAGAAAAGLLGMGVAETIALKPIHPIEVQARPVVVDGPPTDVQPAPPPVLHKRARPRPDPDDAVADADLAELVSAGPTDAQAAPDATVPEAAAAQPSSPCGQLASPADRLVCSTPSLASADQAEENLFRTTLADSEAPEAVRDEQRRWRQARDQAAEAGGEQGLTDLYDARIRELRGPGG